MLSQSHTQETDSVRPKRGREAAEAPAVQAAAPRVAEPRVAGPREPNYVPGDTPEELPPGGPEELPGDEPSELPPGSPEELPGDQPVEWPPETPKYRASAAGRQGGLTVLLVEDDSLIRLSTADMLQELGHRVVEAGSAGEALEALDGGRIDLLICDVSLPDLSGVELARRARLERPRLPVIFATGHCEIEGLQEAGLAQSSLTLSKPFEEEALSDCLRRAAASA